MLPTRVGDPDLTAITAFVASTATPERGGLPYLDAVLPAEHRLAATRVVRDLGAIPPDAILYLLAQPLLRLRLPSELLLTQWDSCATRTPAQYLRCVARIAKDDLAHALLRKGD